MLRSLFSKYSRATLIQLGVGAIIVIVLLSFAAFGGYFFDPYSLVTAPYQPPSAQHIAGSDVLGRDIFSRLITGTRQTLTVAAVAVAISAIIGGLSGTLVGYLGGKVDRVVSMIMDAWYSFPDIVLVILFALVLGQGAFNAGLAIGLSHTPQFFRVLRSEAFTTKSAVYVEAERVLGAHTPWILARHLIPAALPSLVVMITIGLARSILTIGGLGFLGLGIPPPTPEWGTDLGLARNVILNGIWWPTTLTGLMIFVAVLGFNQLGNGLNSLIRATRS